MVHKSCANNFLNNFVVFGVGPITDHIVLLLNFSLTLVHLFRLGYYHTVPNIWPYEKISEIEFSNVALCRLLKFKTFSFWGGTWNFLFDSKLDKYFGVGPYHTLLLCSPSAFTPVHPARDALCRARPSRGVSVVFVMVHKSCANNFLNNFVVFGVGPITDHIVLLLNFSLTLVHLFRLGYYHTVPNIWPYEKISEILFSNVALCRLLKFRAFYIWGGTRNFFVRFLIG